MAKLPKIKENLNQRQKAFIAQLLLNGGNLTQAIIAIGYKGKNPHAAASGMWRSANVQAAFGEALNERIKTGRALAVATFEDIARNSRKDAARVAAAAHIKQWADNLEGLGRSAGGVTINLNLANSDHKATMTIEGEAQHIDEQGAISAMQGDDEE